MPDNKSLCKVGGHGNLSRRDFVMSTTIYEVPFDLLQEWLLLDSSDCGLFASERLNGVHVNVGDYLVVYNLGFFGVDRFHSPILDAVFSNRDSAIAYFKGAERHSFNNNFGVDFEVWHVIDADNRRGKMIRRKDYGYEKGAYVVAFYGCLDDMHSHDLVEFDTYSEAHVCATRIVGYPFPKVDIIYRGVHVGFVPICVSSFRVNSEHARTLEALRQLGGAAPLDDFFATPCNEWQVI